MKSFHIKPGIIISLSIGCLFVLRLLTPLQRMFPNRKAKRLMEAGWHEILLAFCIIAVFAFCCWLIHQYLVQTHFRLRALNIKSVKAVIGIICCILISYSINMLLLQVYNPDNDAPPLRRLLSILLQGLTIGSLQYFMVYYIAAVKEAQQSKIEIEQLKQENLQARLTLLKQQISPHFLFNSLSTLKTIATDHNTRQYIMQLSNVYRYLLNYNDNNMASLKDELAFTNSYLYILKERFEDALQLKVDVPEELLPLHIPPLSLQILVENAIKHNIISPTEPLHIQIYHEGNDLLTVENNLQLKLSTESSSGRGLQNIKDRYHLLSGKQIDIMQTGSKFIVKLPLLRT